MCRSRPNGYTHALTAAPDLVDGYDPLNGVEQELQFTGAGAETRIQGVLVRDYPLLVRLLG